MKSLSYLLLSVFVLFLLSCETVPVTGRTQLSLVPAGTVNSMSFDNYKQFLTSHKLSTDEAKGAQVKRVGLKIQKAVEAYFARLNQSSHLSGYQWEFNLVDSPEVNAWCMPGGKVVVYTGILPVAQNDTGLAVVMGHEIAHAVANHGNERMSQSLLVDMGGKALSEVLVSQPSVAQTLFLKSYGMGAQVGFLLPYSRLHESEADHLGLIFMSMAGYDPNEDVAFWERMARGKKVAGGQPDFMSTHPADATRIADLKKLVPEAMQYYRR